MRIAISLLATGAVTAALGGMFAFCRADESDDPSGAAQPAGAATVDVVTNELIDPVSPTPDSESSPGWRADPKERKPSLLVQDLAAIRERVGSAIPESWEGLAGGDAADRNALFAQSVQALEAQNPLNAAPPSLLEATGEGGVSSERQMPNLDPSGWEPPRSLPPALASSGDDLDLGLPPGDGPTQFDTPSLPPTPGIAPCDAPESWRDLSRLLLATSRDLDRMAHVLEEERRYDDADRLRALSAHVRRENRRVAPAARNGGDPTAYRSEN